MALESALLFESPEEIWARVFRTLRPRTKPPEFRIEFRPFASPGASARLEEGRMLVRISDLLEGAPAPVLEALAFVLLGKLLRRPVPRVYAHRYRLYLNRKDMRRKADLVRQIRGRKFISGPQGRHHNLDDIFEQLNQAYFDGLMARPLLGWSRAASRSTLGHYDPSHNAIIISRVFDRPEVPRIALEYVLFHEMLHLRYPVETRGARRRVHPPVFRAAEKQFARFKEAREILKRMGTYD